MKTQTKIAIDWQLAENILDRLGYSLRDLSIEYGGVVIPSGDISHELYYPSIYNSHNLLGYVWIENDIYSAKHGHNHRTPEMAALDLLDEGLVQSIADSILLERQLVPDYF